MSYTFTSLRNKIRKAEEDNSRYSAEDLEIMIYEKYQDGKLTPNEYNELCTILEFAF